MALRRLVSFKFDYLYSQADKSKNEYSQ
ncbi:hypothetical protein EMIT0158MI4_70180 [Burkholderia ambifaria]